MGLEAAKPVGMQDIQVIREDCMGGRLPMIAHICYIDLLKKKVDFLMNMAISSEKECSQEREREADCERIAPLLVNLQMERDKEGFWKIGINGDWTCLKIRNINTARNFFEEIKLNYAKKLYDELSGHHFKPIVRPEDIEVLDWPKEHKKNGHIYFLQVEKGGPIKIGFSINLKSRLCNINLSNHKKATLIAKLRGTMETEKSLHKRFSAHRKHGEWFEPAPEILAYIEKHKV